MRRFALAAMVVVMAQGASAADLPILRGSYIDAVPPRASTNWEGFYVGGHAGYGSSNMKFGDSNKDMSAQLLSNPIIRQLFNVPAWPNLGTVSHRNVTFGGFVGYNVQWEDVVIGFEGNYSHGTFSGSAAAENVSGYDLSGTSSAIVRTNSASSMTIKDTGSLRIRGGYVVDNFMPYAFAGMALGRADISRSVAVNATTYTFPGAVPQFQFSWPLTSTNKNQFIYGIAAGAGVDVKLFGGLFLRAEYEYLQFTSAINTNIHTIRGGVGYKF
jgi:outer membrane immunogenic protein